MSWEEFAGTDVHFSHSTTESQRFGMSIARLVVGEAALARPDLADTLRRLLMHAEEELVIIRYPSQAMVAAPVVAESGRAVIPADVLMYWDAPAGFLPPDEGALAADDLVCTISPPDDASLQSAVASVVRDSFAAYGNHYSANPALDANAALEGYVEWACRSASGATSDVIVLSHGTEPVGVATVQTSASGLETEVLLAGLTGAAQGRGWYRHLLSAADSLSVTRGSHRLVISTQSHNVRAQRSWARFGLRPFAALTTVHAMRKGDR